MPEKAKARGAHHSVCCAATQRPKCRHDLTQSIHLTMFAAVHVSFHDAHGALIKLLANFENAKHPKCRHRVSNCCNIVLPRPTNDVLTLIKFKCMYALSHV